VYKTISLSSSSSSFESSDSNHNETIKLSDKTKEILKVPLVLNQEKISKTIKVEEEAKVPIQEPTLQQSFTQTPTVINQKNDENKKRLSNNLKNLSDQILEREEETKSSITRSSKEFLEKRNIIANEFEKRKKSQEITKKVSYTTPTFDKFELKPTRQVHNLISPITKPNTPPPPPLAPPKKLNNLNMSNFTENFGYVNQFSPLMTQDVDTQTSIGRLVRELNFFAFRLFYALTIKENASSKCKLFNILD
jgi:hypothetical protein